MSQSSTPLQQYDPNTIRELRDYWVASDIGLGHQNGWLGFYNLVSTDSSSEDFGFEDIECSIGFVEHEVVPHPDNFERGAVHNWIPLYRTDVNTILVNVLGDEGAKLCNLDLLDTMLDSLVEPDTICIAARNSEEDVDKGFICFRREPRILFDTAEINFHIVGLVCADPLQRASLLAALYNQIVVDVELAHLPLASAGMYPKLKHSISVESGVDLKQEPSLKLLRTALGKCFSPELGPLPEWFDLSRWQERVKEFEDG